MTPWHDAPVTPHAWQARAVAAAVDAVKAGEKPVISAIMGAGKSEVLGCLARLGTRKLGPSRPVVVLAPTQALVRQLHATMRRWVADTGMYYADRKQPDATVVVACYASALALAGALDARGRRCGLLLVDEVHRSESEQAKAAVEALRPGGMVGCTATAYRSNRLEGLSLWTTVAGEPYTYAEALRDGVLVPVRPRPWSGDFTDCDEVCLQMIGEVSGPGIVAAKNITDAEEHAGWLTDRGVVAEAIHSKQSATHQRQLRAQLEAGELRALVHVQLLTEGVDMPYLRWICMRVPVGSLVRIVQQIGRGTRRSPGKTHCDVLDPHNLMASRALDNPARLGLALDDPESYQAPAGEYQPPEAGVLPPATVVVEAMAWTQALIWALQEQGAVELGTVAGAGWRTRRANQGNLNRLQGLNAHYSRFLPPAIRAGMMAIARPPVSSGLPAGAVADLIQMLLEVRRQDPRKAHSHRWRGPDWGGLELPTLPEGVADGAGDMQRLERNRKARERRAAEKR